MADTGLAQILEELDNCGVRLSVDPTGGLRIHPATKLAIGLLSAIRAHKSEIVAHLRRATASSVLSASPLPGSGCSAGEQLTAMQRAIWLTCQIEPDSIAYNVPHVLEIRGQLDVELLRDCLRQLQQRHGSLRTRFIVVNGEPLQVVDADRDLPFSITHVDELDLQRSLEAESNHIFDLESGPLFYAKIFRVAHDNHVFLFNAHHIVFDGWSSGVLLGELSLLYGTQGAHKLKPLPFDYLDFSRWLAQTKNSDPRRRAQSFWKTSLKDAPEQLAFPTDFPRPARMTARGGTFAFQIPEAIAQSARTLCRQQGITLYQLLLSAFQVLLFRYAGQKDLVVGVPFANRSLRGLESLIGYFVNPLPIRQLVDPTAPFAALLASNKQRLMQVLAHQDYPFEEIVIDLNPARNLSYSPVFQHVFSFQNGSDVPFGIAGADVRLLAPAEPAAKFDIWFSITDGSDGLNGSIQFNRDLFETESARRWAANYAILLEGVCAKPTRAVLDLPFMDAAERTFISKSLDNSHGQFRPAFARIQNAFEQCAQRIPDAIAVRCGKRLLSYGELEGRSNAIAGYLRDKGVCAGDLVGICMSRTPEMLASLIAIVKLDAAYVPLDPNYPPLRLNQIAGEAGLKWVVCDTTTRGLIGTAREFQVEDAPLSGAAIAVPAPGTDTLSHVIFTSGSTGRPKGVMVTHSNVLALIEWARSTYEADDLAAVLCSTSIGFDLSVFEIWAPLSVGGSIVLIEDASHLVGAGAQKISLINTVPSALRLLVNETAVPPGVRVINVCGEPLGKALVKDLFHSYPTIGLVNLYGPTEDTTFSTMCRVGGDSSEDPSIGVPIVHSYARVVDAYGALVPIGAIGELYLGGCGVTKGYINSPDQTAERFVRHVNYAGVEAIEFRTGDLVRLRSDGQLYFVGRIDHQIKIRGFRVETGEIEHAIRQMAEVRDVCVLAHKRQAGDVLIAYVAHANPACRVDAVFSDTIEQNLRSRLPDYMVPQTIVFVDELPLNGSGKVDRRALLAIPIRTDRVAATGKPTNHREELIAEIWKCLLQLDTISVHDDFFKLGGNSILAVQMISRVNKEFGITLPTYAAFEYKTAAALAGAVRSCAGNAGERSTLKRVEMFDGVEPTYPQLAMLRDPSRIQFNMCRPMWVNGPLDEDALRRSLAGLVARQDALRASFVVNGGAVRMHVRSSVPDVLRVVTLERDDRESLQQQIASEIDKERRLAFNLQEGPPVRALLIRVASQKHVFVLSVHHVVADASSINIIKNDLAAFYAAELDDSCCKPGPLPIGYGDFVHWQRELRDTDEYQRQLGYWVSEFAGLAVQGKFPINPENLDRSGPLSKYIEFEPPADWRHRLKASAARQGTTPYVVLAAAMHLALADYSGLEQQMVWTPISRRTQLELEKSVGLYTNLIAVAERVDGDLTVREFLDRIERKVLRAHANSDVSALAAVMKNPAVRPTLPVIGLNFIDASLDGGDWEFCGATVKSITVNADDVALVTALEVSVLSAPESMEITLAYDTAIFHADAVRQIVKRLMNAADGLVGNPKLRLADLLHSWRKERETTSCLVAG
jgi:amino acid adenylation domain-containing protein